MKNIIKLFILSLVLSVILSGICSILSIALSHICAISIEYIAVMDLIVQIGIFIIGKKFITLNVKRLSDIIIRIICTVISAAAFLLVYEVVCLFCLAVIYGMIMKNFH